MSAPKTEPLKIANTALIVVFLAVLFLPTVDTFLSIDKTPRLNENRAMAEKPVFHGLARTKDYLAALELFFNDHFGYRKALVRMQSKWKSKLFGEAAVSEALIGTDGWLYTTANRTIESYTGVSRFTPKNLAAWQKLLETRRDWLKKRGIAYVVVVTPDKHTIYPEHLPTWLKPKPGPTKLDQWFEYFRQNSNLQPLDLRPILLEAKKTSPVYLMTDTHWNGLGAYLGYRALIGEISKQVPSVQPLPDNAFALQPISGYKGDLAVLLGQESSFPELQANAMIPSAHLPRLTITETVVHAGKKHIALTRTQNSEGTGTAIVFRDSFGVAWFPLVGFHFHDVIFACQRNFDPILIEKERPVVVVDQIVERIVNTHDPVEMLEEDRLPD